MYVFICINISFTSRDAFHVPQIILYPQFLRCIFNSPTPISQISIKYPKVHIPSKHFSSLFLSSHYISRISFPFFFLAPFTQQPSIRMFSHDKGTKSTFGQMSGRSAVSNLDFVLNTGITMITIAQCTGSFICLYVSLITFYF